MVLGGGLRVPFFLWTEVCFLLVHSYQAAVAWFSRVLFADERYCLCSSLFTVFHLLCYYLCVVFSFYYFNYGDLSMKLVVVCIRDSALAAYMRPFFAPTCGVAVRAFTDEVRKSDSQMSSHRADYVLFELAAFDEETGLFHNLDSPRQLIRGADIGE